MNEGISILIDRMRTNPEDFAPSAYINSLNRAGSSSWRSLAEYAADAQVFTAEERAAVTGALDEVTRKNFTAKILELLAAPSAEEEMRQYKLKEEQNYLLTTATSQGTITAARYQQQALQNEYTSGLYNGYQAAQQQAKLK
jgi:hypothetical protein